MPSLLKSLLMPLPLLLILLTLSVVLCYRQRKIGFWLLGLSTTLLWLASSSAITERLAATLELTHPALHQAPKLDNIVVLGCMHSAYDFLPLSSQLAECSMARLIEGVRLWHQHPEARLILSGHLPGIPGNHTEVASDLAIALGVNPDRILQVSTPTNTQQEAATVAPLIVNQRSALVTSALHMPRSMNWFTYYGAQITPAPTHFRLRRPLDQFQSGGFVPSARSIQTLSLTHYEYLGLWQQRLALWWDPEDP
ncbi:ElyC/SanA/YdcF family protein [Alkalimonas collagenimarina]|uniref:ElyC/SanA/YdcF family protein n=1 Tax=Alkalimonas collagenimarina TaxID=400390 RepID=A0ABT9GXG4_9GAMM|nr:ElyC/SanA/YdcF family protein [Alkalimonas collagenimarina]MDP4535375.1 ElyC/SanA/YdcF family protein [Alkalimonas collagenimarina]